MGGRIMAEVSDALGLSNQSEQSEINPYTTENRMVVLLVIICAVISLLGFLSILPWNRIWRSHERERAARLANTGLKKKHIKALPSMVYSKVRSQPDIDIVAECPICLAEFMEGERVRTLPKCRHSFHMECVDKWLLSHSSCPICRHCFLSSDLCIWQKSWMVKGVELQLPEDNLVRTNEEVILADVEQDNPNPPPPPPPTVEVEDLPAESVVIETEEGLSDNGAASEFPVDGQIDEGQFQIPRTNEELILANVEQDNRNPPPGIPVPNFPAPFKVEDLSTKSVVIKREEGLSEDHLPNQEADLSSSSQI